MEPINSNRVEFDLQPATKWEPASVGISNLDGSALGKGVLSMLVQTYHDGTPSESQRITLQVAGDTEKKRELNEADIKKLLADAGITDIKPETLGSQTKIEIDNLKDKNALVKIAHALSNDLHGPGGQTTYAALDSKTIGEIENHHLKTTGKTPSEAGLVNITTDTRNAQWHRDRGISEHEVKTIDAVIPNGPVAAIREDTMMAVAKGDTYAQTISKVEMRSNATQAVEAMKAAGLKAEMHVGEKTFVTVEGTADQVAHVLASKKLMPEHIAKEVADHALAAHPHAQVINNAVIAEAKEQAQAIHNGQNPNAAAGPATAEAHAPEAHLPEGHLPEGHVPHVRGKAGGGLKGLLIGSIGGAAILAANGASAAEVGEGAANGAADAVLPGASDGFKAARGDNGSLDTWFARADTATQGVATGAAVWAAGSAAIAGAGLVASATVVAAPVGIPTALAGGASALGGAAVAGVAEVANLGLSLVHDVTYVTGLSKEGGIITGLVDVGGQLAHSKAADAAKAHVVHTATELGHEAMTAAKNTGAAVVHAAHAAEVMADHAGTAIASAATKVAHEAHVEGAITAGVHVAKEAGALVAPLVKSMTHAKDVAVAAITHEPHVEKAVAAVSQHLNNAEATVENWKMAAVAAMKGIASNVSVASGPAVVAATNVAHAAAAGQTQVASR